MSGNFEYGTRLDNGTHIIHGSGTQTKSAFPSELNIPGDLQTFNLGHRMDAETPSFCGPTGCLAFTTENRMPRHVHVTVDPQSTTPRYIVEKIMVLDGVALAELGGEVYVIPPMTLVLIGAGVPHAWVACPPDLDLQQLGVADMKVVSNGHFTAFFEYEEPTGFFPTAQTERLEKPSDYVKCDDLQSIRFPELTLQDIRERAFFVWGKNILKL